MEERSKEERKVLYGKSHRFHPVIPFTVDSAPWRPLFLTDVVEASTARDEELHLSTGICFGADGTDAADFTGVVVEKGEEVVGRA
jgi:hypothetical protein